MLMDIALAGLGLVILLLAGDSLVKGAVNLALRAGIPALLVSLTIVAFGTSAPELLVSVQAVMMNAPGIALGNVIGSNIANVLLVLGAPALLTGLHTSGCETRRTFSMMIVATLAFIALAHTGVFSRVDGAILLVMLGILLADSVRTARAHRREARHAAGVRARQEETGYDEDDIEGVDASLPTWKTLGYVALGLIGLPLGADILVDASVRIAADLNVPDAVIGLTLVAIGTSLPELATTVMAALRGQTEVAMGNVIGSNLFNLLAIIGIASFVGPIPVEPGLLRLDVWVMLGASLLLIPFVFLKWNMGRPWGVALLAAYAVYLFSIVG